MAHYLCAWNQTDSAMLMPEYKENKKTISYVGDFKWDFNKKKYKYKNYYSDPDNLYMIKKWRLEEIGFIVEAATYDEARKKRVEFIKNRFKEELERFEEKVKQNCELYKDIIFAAYQSNMAVTIYVNDNFDARNINFGTEINYSDGEDGEVCKPLKTECFERIMTFLKETFNLKTKMHYSNKNVYINLDHPEIKVYLTTANYLKIEPSNGSKYCNMGLEISTSSGWGSYIGMDSLTVERYSKLRAEFDELSKKPDFFYIYKENCVEFSDGEWHQERLTFDKSLRFKQMQKKDFDIIIDLGVSMMYTTSDFVLERFRVRKTDNGKKLLLILNSTFGSAAFENSTETILAELKKQLGRDMWNTFLLINEVSDE